MKWGILSLGTSQFGCLPCLCVFSWDPSPEMGSLTGRFPGVSNSFHSHVRVKFILDHIKVTSR